MSKIHFRGHSELNQGPIDLQSIALPLSYTPTAYSAVFSKQYHLCFSQIIAKIHCARAGARTLDR